MIKCIFHLNSLYNDWPQKETVIFVSPQYFCVPSMFASVPRETLRSRGKKSLFPAGPVIIKCFVIPANSKLEKKNPAEKSFVLRRLAHKFAAVSKITCESKVHVVVSLGSL